jgi:biopolymer transport protein TolQ
MSMMNLLCFSLPMADLAGAFWESTLPGQLIVILLIIGSAGAWTIMCTKGWQLRCARNMTLLFLESFRAKQNPTALYVSEESYVGSPLEVIYQDGCQALEAELKANRAEAAATGRDEQLRLSMNQLETLRAVVDRNVADEALVLEEQMGLLATAVSAAPFLGLLGTVWGVMDAFSGMASSGNAALSAVAPGISGALLTTIIGLLVALPSMIGYNLLSAQIRKLSVQMDNFAQEFITSVQNTYVIEVK